MERNGSSHVKRVKMRSINDQLRSAAASGNEAKIKALLCDSNCDVLSKGKKDGLTALMLAAGGGYEACVNLLLPVSDPLAKDKGDWTALMYAASWGQDSCVRLLLPVSDALAKSDKEQTASEIATESGYSQLANFIDGYAVAQSEKLALELTIPVGAPQKRSSLSV